MREYKNFYIDGKWQSPASENNLEIIDPSTEEVMGLVSAGSSIDVDRAVAAARAAFPMFSKTSVQERLDLLAKIIEIYQKRYADMAQVITEEMGAPITLSQQVQVGGGLVHFLTALEELKKFQFTSEVSSAKVLKQAIGVCGMISPWNWPIAQVTAKVAPALAMGCTMVLKPSEIAPMSSMILAEILEEAGVPAGVFNLVNGYGPEVGGAISAHPGVDMVSFTGSLRAGSEISRAAAPTVKRVLLELGGKSANIILDDADLEEAIPRTVMALMSNTGQTCLAPTRMLVPRALHDKIVDIAVATAKAIKVGDTSDPATVMGPLASAAQFEKVNKIVSDAIADGVELRCGGVGRPEGIEKGYYVSPSIFANVDNSHFLAQEEIFGPVLAIIPYDSEKDAVVMANDSKYGLAGYVQSASKERAFNIAAALDTGYIVINDAQFDFAVPFGGFKQSGNGREWGAAGFDEYLETKSILGS